MPDLDDDQRDRYSRHLAVDEIGQTGQQALLDAAVLVVGAGGLGSAAIQYLAASGVGTLGIVDDDVVERSNLQRQVLHGTDDIGRPKVDSAADFVAGLNPDVRVETYETEFTPENARELVEEYDVVVDGSDNYRTKYLLNDACTLAGTPFVHATVYHFEGQVATFPADEDSPCYRCLFPAAPPDEDAPDVAKAGLLSPLPGTLGTVEATETIKHLVGAGDLLDGRMLVYDALGMAVDEVAFQQDPSCPLCGEDSVDSLDEIEYASPFAIE